MFLIRFFTHTNRYFVLSFGFHALCFVVLYNFGALDRSNNSLVSVKYIDRTSNELNQKSSSEHSKKEAISRKKVTIKSTSFYGDSLTQNKNRDDVQHIIDPSGQSNVSEVYSDTSTAGNYYQSYLDRVRSKIEFHKTYPKTSIVLKESGSVKVRVKLVKSGQVQKIEIVESSQIKRLDDAAIKAVADASPFAEFPDEVKFTYLSILIPIKFELN